MVELAILFDDRERHGRTFSVTQNTEAMEGSYKLFFVDKRDEKSSTCPSGGTTLQGASRRSVKDDVASLGAKVGRMKDVTCVQVLRGERSSIGYLCE